MATTTQAALPIETASPIALWHLLSLDAPTVAALWVWFIARASHISLPLAEPMAMAIAVWMLYVVDRLLDARGLEAEHALVAGELEARHLFHYCHRRVFLVGLAVAAIGVAILVPKLDPSAMRLYCIEGGLLLVWFAILHATCSAHRVPKEIVVGIFFAAATFIPTVAREPSLRGPLLPAAALFATLCSLNCLFIYAWEHAGLRPNARLPHATTRIAVAHLSAAAIAAVIAGSTLALSALPSAKPIAVACGLAAVMLLALHRNRQRLSRNHLRAAADMALLTPILLLPFLR